METSRFEIDQALHCTIEDAPNVQRLDSLARLHRLQDETLAKQMIKQLPIRVIAERLMLPALVN